MIFTFQTEDGSQEIQYSTEFHILMSNGKEFFKEEVDVSEHHAHVMQRGKLRNPKVLRIQLGQKCNMACSYCLQDPLGDKEDLNATNEVSAFIAKLKATIDFSDLERIELWGGEPLLYWRKIQIILEELDSKDVTWSMVTNATKLKCRHVGEIRNTKGDWNIAISHDGLGHAELRGKEDPFKIESAKRAFDLLMSPNPEKNSVSVSINSMISENNWDVYSNLKYFHAINPNLLVNFELLSAYDDSSMSHVLDKNMIKHMDSLERVIKEASFAQISGKPAPFGNNSLVHFSMGFYPLLKSFQVKNTAPDHYGCGVDNDQVLSTDLKGVLLPCQNTSAADFGFGTLDTIDASKMTEKVQLTDKSKCESCPVVRLCKRGCPLNSTDSSYFKKNCSARYGHYMQLLQTTMTLGLQQSSPFRLKREELSVRNI
ncbi:SPASM domain-containing protein [Ewingella americana]|uniref:SPASM domain-containing protein n=1 Tax=Ewingella americana TaxID=41202 RepID=A0A502GCW8_9GAMM|nr:SPASM domain-containing protein [Ewingella americana]TPG60117.1 SPASM domain-containing protein [Ewingella americana]